VTIAEFFTNTNLERSLLIGYYGGGNFGDELLLETMQMRLQRKGVIRVEICYQHAVDYGTYHRDFHYSQVFMSSKPQFLKAILRNKTLVIGGGGLWGLDVNNNIFLLSLMLFLSRWILRKKIYLIGVGYYNSTDKLGHRSAWLAGKAANHIIARDDESAANFGKITKHVSQDRDIAWQLETLPESIVPYEEEAENLAKQLPVNGKTIFITLRRFKPNQQNAYNDRIGQLLDAPANAKRPIIISLMEPKSVDPAGYATLIEWQKLHPNIIIADFSYNPIAFFVWLKKHASQLAIIAPQFHVIVTALMSEAAFLPIAYDNKVTELLEQVRLTAIPIGELEGDALQIFVDGFFSKKSLFTTPIGEIA
jgi:polysaccharide pyruvyl transferase WcaK-like protein